MNVALEYNPDIDDVPTECVCCCNCVAYVCMYVCNFNDTGLDCHFLYSMWTDHFC